MSWALGTIVVCVDDRLAYEPLPVPPVNGQPLAAGHYYTVRACIESWPFREGRRLAVFLKENKRPGWMHGRLIEDFPWGADRFRLAESTHSEAGSVCQKEPVNK